MAKGISVHLEGHKELIRALDKLGGQATFNLSRNAARAAMVPVNKDAKQRAKGGQGYAPQGEVRGHQGETLPAARSRVGGSRAALGSRH